MQDSYYRSNDYCIPAKVSCFFLTLILSRRGKGDFYLAGKMGIEFTLSLQTRGEKGIKHKNSNFSGDCKGSKWNGNSMWEKEKGILPSLR